MTDCKFFVWYDGCTKNNCPFRHPSRIRETTPICKMWLKDLSCTNRHCQFQHPAEDLLSKAKEKAKRERSITPPPKRPATPPLQSITVLVEPAIPPKELVQLIAESFGDQETIKQVSIAQYIKNRTGKTWKECSGNMSFRQFFEKYMPLYTVRSEGIGLEKVTRPAIQVKQEAKSKPATAAHDFINAILDKSAAATTTSIPKQEKQVSPLKRPLEESHSFEMAVEPAAKRQRIDKDRFSFYFGASATPTCNPEQCMMQHHGIHSEILKAYQQYI